MILPIWHEDRHCYKPIKPAGALRRSPVPNAESDESSCFLVKNSVSDRGSIFRHQDDYLLFREIILKHMESCCDTVAYLLTQHSYEIILRIRPELFIPKRTILEGKSELKIVSSMLSHYVHAVNRKYQRRGPMFTGGFRALCLKNGNEVSETVQGMHRAALALDGVFPLPVCFEVLDCSDLNQKYQAGL